LNLPQKGSQKIPKFEFTTVLVSLCMRIFNRCYLVLLLNCFLLLTLSRILWPRQIQYHKSSSTKIEPLSSRSPTTPMKRDLLCALWFKYSGRTGPKHVLIRFGRIRFNVVIPMECVRIDTLEKNRRSHPKKFHRYNESVTLNFVV